MRLVFGDISGYYETFIKFIEKYNPNEIISLGDIIDRGPNSKACVEFFMNNKKRQLIIGNHEHMMINIYESYVEKKRIPTYSLLHWLFVNGGKTTLNSYGIDLEVNLRRSEVEGLKKSELNEMMKEPPVLKIIEDLNKIPKTHIDFLRESKIFIEKDNYFLSHAPMSDWHNKKILSYPEIDNNELILEKSCFWNRSIAKKRKDYFIIYGHMNKDSAFVHTKKYPKGIHLIGLEENLPKDAWGICLDTAKSGFLTAFDLDSKKLFYQEIK